MATRWWLLGATLLAACAGKDKDSDGDGDGVETDTVATSDVDVQVTLEPVGSPTPLVWRLGVTADAPVSITAAFDADDGHHVEIPVDPAVATDHQRLAKGFHPDTTYTVTVTATDADGGVVTVDGGTLTTDPLPDDFPTILRHVVETERIQAGYTLVLLRPNINGDGAGGDYLVALDNEAEVAWFLEPADAVLLTTAFPDGTLVSVAADPESDGGPIHQYDWEGNKLESWVPAGIKNYGIPCQAPGFHHEAFSNTAAGTWVALSKQSMEGVMVPVDYDNPTLRPATIGGEVVFEFDPSTDDCAIRSSVNVAELMDTSRIGYDSLSTSHFDGELDWGHGNAIWVDPTDGGFVVSIRNQDAIVKVLDGELKWILGDHANWRAPWQPLLLDPIGGDFEWQFHQHSPQMHPTDPGRMLVMDNGGPRIFPFDGKPLTPQETWYSRIVEYQIDEAAGTIDQTWELKELDGKDFFTPYVGDADYLVETDHVLATFGFLERVGDQTTFDRGYGGRSVRIVEVEHSDPTDFVLDVELVAEGAGENGGWTAYRAQRVTDLYGLVP